MPRWPGVRGQRPCLAPVMWEGTGADVAGPEGAFGVEPVVTPVISLKKLTAVAFCCGFDGQRWKVIEQVSSSLFMQGAQ